MNQLSKNQKKITESNIASALRPEDFNDIIAEKKVNEKTFSVWVRQLLQNWRQGTVASKGRSDVSFSRKKPWKQKGTGRARAGTARSPLWRGGGTIFGPQARVRTLNVSQKMKKGVLVTLLWEALRDGRIVCLDWQMTQEKPKTSDAYFVLKQANFIDKKINLLLPVDDVKHALSFGNLSNVQLLAFDELNAYNLALADIWVVLKKDLDAFKQVVDSWN